MVLGWLHPVPPSSACCGTRGSPEAEGPYSFPARTQQALPSRGHPKITCWLLPGILGLAPTPGPALSPLQGTGEEGKPGENESSEKRKAGRVRENPVTQRGREVWLYKGPACGRARAWAGRGSHLGCPTAPLLGHGTAN